MAKATATFCPPVPVEPELDRVTLILTAQEAKDLAVILGRTVPGSGYGTSVTTIHSALWDAGVNSSDLGRDDRYKNLPDIVQLTK